MVYFPSIWLHTVQSLNKLFETTAGYGKMPDYERVFTEFLLSLVQSKYKESTFLKSSFWVQSKVKKRLAM